MDVPSNNLALVSLRFAQMDRNRTESIRPDLEGMRPNSRMLNGILFKSLKAG